MSSLLEFHPRDVELLSKLKDWCKENEKSLPLEEEDIKAVVELWITPPPPPEGEEAPPAEEAAAPKEPAEDGDDDADVGQSDDEVADADAEGEGAPPKAPEKPAPPPHWFSEEDAKRVQFLAKHGLWVGPRNDVNDRHGFGKSLYPNGDLYEGDYFEGKRHGQGYYIYSKPQIPEAAEEATEEGDEQARDAFKPKKLLPIGVPDTKDQAVWDAVRDLPKDADPESLLAIAKGLKVTVPRLQATLRLGTTHPSYRGGFEADKKSGQGLMRFQDGAVYEGSWDMDVPSGDGVMTYPNGDTYRGSFAKGLKHGHGVYVYSDGASVVEGEWNAGTLVSGTWSMCDGTAYAGGFHPQTNRPLGSGGRFAFPRDGYAVGGTYDVHGRWYPGVMAGATVQ